MDKTDRPLVPVLPMQAPVASAVIDDGFIKSRILTIRGVQVLLDSDLARIYQVETRVFNQAVKRNENRFPPNFRFRLDKEEYKALISQTVTSKDGGEKRGGRQKAPYVFTEQGIAMLSGVLKSDVAVQTSVRLMEIFVAMRKTLASIAPLLDRIDVVERRQIADQTRNEERFDTIFRAMDGGDFPPQKIFYDGQLWVARALVDKLVKRARKSLVLVDNWATVETLDMLAAKQKGVAQGRCGVCEARARGLERPTTRLCSFGRKAAHGSMVAVAEGNAPDGDAQGEKRHDEHRSSEEKHPRRIHRRTDGPAAARRPRRRHHPAALAGVGHVRRLPRVVRRSR